MLGRHARARLRAERSGLGGRAAEDQRGRDGQSGRVRAAAAVQAGGGTARPALSATVVAGVDTGGVGHDLTEEVSGARGHKRQEK